MPSLKIKVHRCDQKEPAWPDLKSEKEYAFENCTVVEKGMSSGETAIMFTLTDPETGKHYIAQTSANILRSLMGAVKGAEEHWAENPVKNIWK